MLRYLWRYPLLKYHFIFAAFFIVAGGWALTPTTFAASPDRPMIEAEIGGETSSEEGFGLLLKIDGAVLNGFNIVLASVRSEIKIDSTDHGLIPYFDIDFTPLTLGTNHFKENGLGVSFLPLELSRNISIGIGSDFQAHLLGIVITGNYDRSRLVDSHSDLFFKIVINALGYEFTRYLDEAKGNFRGFSFADIHSEFGAYLNRKHTVRVALGLSGDLALGDQGNYGFATQSQLGAFLKISNQFSNKIQAELQAGIRSIVNSQAGARKELYMRAGVSYYFLRSD